MQHKIRHGRFISKNPADNVHASGLVDRIPERGRGEDLPVNLHDQNHDRPDRVIPEIGGIFHALVVEGLLQIQRHQTVVNRGNRVEKVPGQRLRQLFQQFPRISLRLTTPEIGTFFVLAWSASNRCVHCAKSERSSRSDASDTNG